MPEKPVIDADLGAVLPGFWNRAVVQLVGQSPVFGLLCWVIMYGMPSQWSSMMNELKAQRAHDAEQTKEMISTVKDLSKEIRTLADRDRRQNEAAK